MVTSASARDRFYRTIEPILGADAAEFLMNALPPTGWADVATKADVADLRTELRADIAEVRGELGREIAEVRGELGREIAEVRGELGREIGGLRGEIGDLRGELGREIGGVRGDIADVRASMVTTADLGELLRLHVDGRIGAMSRQLFVGITGLHVSMTAALVAAVRL